MFRKIKAILFGISALAGLYIFSVFVTCCYCGPFTEPFQIVTGMMIMAVVSLILVLAGIIGCFIILDGEDEDE